MLSRLAMKSGIIAQMTRAGHVKFNLKCEMGWKLSSSWRVEPRVEPLLYVRHLQHQCGDMLNE